MATLAEAVDETETDWLVSADIPHGTEYLTVESETVQILAHFPAGIDPQTRAATAPRIRVARAAGGTTAASHADTTALTPLIPPSSAGGGAGGLNVTGTVSGSVPATTDLELQGTVTDEGAGAAAYIPAVGAPAMLRGPFRMNFDTADITTNGALVPGLGALGANTIIVGVYIRVITGWDGGGYVGFSTVDAELDDWGPTLAIYLIGSADDNSDGALQRPRLISVKKHPDDSAVSVVDHSAAVQPHLTTADLQYVVAFVTEEAPSAAGAMDVYVATATFVS